MNIWVHRLSMLWIDWKATMGRNYCKKWSAVSNYPNSRKMALLSILKLNVLEIEICKGIHQEITINVQELLLIMMPSNDQFTICKWWRVHKLSLAIWLSSQIREQLLESSIRCSWACSIHRAKLEIEEPFLPNLVTVQIRRGMLVMAVEALYRQ